MILIFSSLGHVHKVVFSSLKRGKVLFHLRLCGAGHRCWRMHITTVNNWILCTGNVTGGFKLIIENVCDYRPAWWRSMSSVSWTWSQLWGRETTHCRNSTCSCTAKTCSICSCTPAQTHTVRDCQLSLRVFICLSNYGDNTQMHIIISQSDYGAI